MNQPLTLEMFEQAMKDLYDVMGERNGPYPVMLTGQINVSPASYRRLNDEFSAIRWIDQHQAREWMPIISIDHDLDDQTMVYKEADEGPDERTLLQRIQDATFKTGAGYVFELSLSPRAYRQLGQELDRMGGYGFAPTEHDFSLTLETGRYHLILARDQQQDFLFRSVG